MKNKIVADLLYQIADLLDVKGDIFFKTRAYRIAAQTIEGLNEDIEVIAKEKRGCRYSTTWKSCSSIVALTFRSTSKPRSASILS